MRNKDMRWQHKWWLCAVVLSGVLALVQPASAARLKDIADVEGVRGNDLFGFGLIVGLNGTGDGNKALFTTQGVSNMLETLGVRVDAQQLKMKNVAAVMVTATLPPFARAGSKIDVTLSSLGDAKSLSGGTLLLTPLKAADGNIYAVAQGPIAVGGFSVEAGADAASKNHPTVGTIASGATVERSIPFDLFQAQRVRIVLRRPDFTTMNRVVHQLNGYFGEPVAVSNDPASVEIPLLSRHANNPVAFLAEVEQIEVSPDVGAKVVVNERTGTIIMGEAVTISKVALAHGNLSISIRSETQVSQPGPLAEAGETAVVTNSDVTVSEDNPNLGLLGGRVTLGELVDALNALGATPRDLISIFSALKQAGALQADLIIM
jgi:flagellar P-ring protein precursor FlgI